MISPAPMLHAALEAGGIVRLVTQDDAKYNVQ